VHVALTHHGCNVQAHHAGASCGCIVRMSCPRVWVRIMRERPRPQGKIFFRENNARIKSV